MTITHLAWVECTADAAVADAVEGSLPKRVAISGKDHSLRVMHIAWEGAACLRVDAVVSFADFDERERVAGMNALAGTLRDARGYRFAHIGQDVDGFLDFGRLTTELDLARELQGLIIGREVIEAIGGVPENCQPFSEGYVWRPYVRDDFQQR